MVQPAIVPLDTQFIHYHYQESRSRGSHSQESHSRESHSQGSHSRGSHSQGSHSQKSHSQESHNLTTLYNTWRQAFRCLVVSFISFCQINNNYL